MDKSRTEFLNVDVDLGGQQGLSKLIASMEHAMLVLNQTDNTVSLELREVHNGPDETVNAILDVIQRLKPDARTAWGHCDFRKLNIGIKAGIKDGETTFGLAGNTIKRLAEVNGEVVITIYS